MPMAVHMTINVGMFAKLVTGTSMFFGECATFSPTAPTPQPYARPNHRPKHNNTKDMQGV